MRTHVDAGYVLRLESDPRLRRYMCERGAAAYSRKYDKSVLRRLSSRRELIVVARALADLGTRGEVLDVPCGAGRLVPTLLARATRVTGADVSPAMLGHASRVLAAPIADGRADLARASVGALPFEDGAFDTAVCWRLLHHLTERSVRVRALSELRRVARRGVVASFADADTWKSRFRRWHRAERRSVALSRDELAAEAREAGLVLGPTYRLASAFSHLGAAVLCRA